MAQPKGQPAKRKAKLSKGFLHAVPCPHCGMKLDFRSWQPVDGTGWGSYGLETGNTVECWDDKKKKGCRKIAKIKAVQQVTIVKLVPWRR